MSSSAAAKRSAKRKAKKDDESNQAALAQIEELTAKMAMPTANTNNTTTTATNEATTLSTSQTPTTNAAASSSSSSNLVSTDPRILLKEKGNKAFGEKYMVDAIRYFTEAIEAPPPTDSNAATVASSTSPPFLASVYSNRSASYAALYEWQAALSDANKAIELAPQWSKGYYRRGQAYEGLMEFPEAHAAYEAGLKIDPSDSMLQRQFELVTAILAELQSASSDPSAVPNPEGDQWSRMTNWLLRGRSRFPNLYLKYYSDDYRGVHALTNRIGKDEIIMEIPLSHIMTSEVAKASEIGQQIIRSGVELNSMHTYLASYLLQERKNPNSFWRPYIDCLPKHYRNMPIFFTSDELAYLKGSFTLGKIADRHAELKEEYESIVKLLPSYGTQFSLEDFVWARTVVITRIFGLMINGCKTDGLVPMADMLNHKRPRETSWTYDDSRGAFTITSLKPISHGEQVYDSYGRKCNSRFFVNYGFALEENEDNQCVMWFTLPTSDPHYAMKLRLLATSKGNIGSMIQGNQPKRFQIPIDYSEDVTKECFSFLRFVHAKDSELLLLSSNERFDIKKIEPISLRNEMEVIHDLAIAAETSLSQFDTTIDEDNEILADSSISSNVRNAIVMRRGEKLVLEYYLALLDHVAQIVELPWSQFKKHVAKLSGKGIFDAYITTVIVNLKKNDH